MRDPTLEEAENIVDVTGRGSADHSLSIHDATPRRTDHILRYRIDVSHQRLRLVAVVTPDRER